MHKELRPTDESLTNYVALLWLEVSQPWSVECKHNIVHNAMYVNELPVAFEPPQHHTV